MRKVIVDVSELEQGMEIADTIYNDYGAVVVAEKTILDEHIINKLKKLYVMKVKIYDHDDNVLSANSSELFKAQYKENVELVKDILKDMSQGKNLDIKKVNMATDSIFLRINDNRDIIGCINGIRQIDEYTYAHCVNVSLISMLIGKWLKLDMETIKSVVQTGLLHDIGKSRIDPDILNKPGSLTKDEFEEIKKHTVYGYRIVEKIPDISKDIALGVLMHHEREDGSGYPTGARGEQINLMAKIVAVSDIYDAMTSNRVYRGKESPFEVFELMQNNTFGFLDQIIVNTFIAHISAYYIGDFVKLNSGEKAEVVFINPRSFSRPLVKVGEKYLDLFYLKDVKITELV